METTEKNMEHGEHFNESIVNEVILEDMKKNRIDHMKYLPGMEVLEESDVMDQVISAMNAYDYDKYTEADVRRALAHDNRTPEDFQALLSPAALPLLEEIAQAAQKETRKHFGNSVYMFTPIYIANYCENYCIYCGFNCHNKIRRAKLNAEEIDKEMAAIAKTGLQEILILTGESRAKSDVKYIGEACKIARKYFKVIGLEVYPMNSDEYAHLHECGADYVTVFQETYNSDKYETLHLAGNKRIFPYRLNAQERALKGGMRGVGFAALLGLDDFRKDAFATVESFIIRCVAFEVVLHGILEFFVAALIIDTHVTQINLISACTEHSQRILSTKNCIAVAFIFSHFFHGRFIVYEVIISSNDFFHNVNVSCHRSHDISNQCGIVCACSCCNPCSAPVEALWPFCCSPAAIFTN